MKPIQPLAEVGTFITTHLKSYVVFEKQSEDFLVRTLTKGLGSLWFLIANLVFFVVWIAVNEGLVPMIHSFDPFPFGYLIVIAAFSSTFLAIVVLINQNRQGAMTDIRQRIDFEVNVRAEHEITKILNILDTLQIELGLRKQDSELDKMKERIDIAQIQENVVLGIEHEETGKAKSTP